MPDLSTVERLIRDGDSAIKAMNIGTKVWSAHKNPVDPDITRSWWGEHLADTTMNTSTAGKGDTPFYEVEGDVTVVEGEMKLNNVSPTLYSQVTWETDYAGQELSVHFTYTAPTHPWGMALVYAHEYVNNDSTRYIYSVNLNDFGGIQLHFTNGDKIWGSSPGIMVEGNKYTVKTHLELGVAYLELSNFDDHAAIISSGSAPTSEVSTVVSKYRFGVASFGVESMTILGASLKQMP